MNFTSKGKASLLILFGINHHCLPLIDFNYFINLTNVIVDKIGLLIVHLAEAQFTFLQLYYFLPLNYVKNSFYNSVSSALGNFKSIRNVSQKQRKCWLLRKFITITIEIINLFILKNISWQKWKNLYPDFKPFRFKYWKTKFRSEDIIIILVL